MGAENQSFENDGITLLIRRINGENGRPLVSITSSLVAENSQDDRMRTNVSILSPTEKPVVGHRAANWSYNFLILSAKNGNIFAQTLARMLMAFDVCN